LEVLLFFVFVVAVALGVRLFGYGLSLLRADLEPQVPDAPDEVPKKDDQEAKAALQP
jgi:hypothetical protein